jgi:ribosome recycling factor
MFDTDEYELKMEGALEHFNSELKKIRTGRAHPGMLDGIKVEAYGADMPLNQVANITAPEAQLLQITPFDPANIQKIAAAIRNDQGLGLNPSDDGARGEGAGAGTYRRASPSAGETGWREG